MSNNTVEFNIKSQKQIEAILLVEKVYINGVVATTEDKVALISSMHDGLNIKMKLQAVLTKPCLLIEAEAI